MFKKKIKYVDFNGVERNEDFFFHLSTPEVIRMEAKLGTTISHYATTLQENQSLDKLIEFIEGIMLTAYGKKSSDGKSFMKSKTLREEFENSQAYAELFEEMMTKPEMAQKFAEGCSAATKTITKASPQVVEVDND